MTKSKIQILSDDLIGKIAAGEVVERPASVVKELLENSIDAGANEIIVDIQDGGKKRIIVMDDGCGMSPEDARLSIARHSTSKIRTADDLSNINTMGFRGEALASVAAVSKLTIETNGYKIIMSGGQTVESGEFGCPNGARIVVEDLFFNVPARKKFLKTDKTESGHIIDIVSRLALAFPKIRFKLKIDGKDELQCLSVSDPQARLMEVFGGEVVNRTVPFEVGNDGIRVHGFLSDSVMSGRASQGIYLFVNKRFVRDRLLNHAVMDGYRSLLPSGQYPLAVVFLEIDPTKVDVNVHPTKQEVRFENSGAVHNFVAGAVRKSAAIAPSPPLTPPRHYNFGGQAYKGGDLPIQFNSQTHQPKNSKTFFSSFRIIGQLSGTYVLCEGEDEKLIAIDQHAAHERIGFEKLKSELEKGAIAAQRLLIPEQIELIPRDAGYLSENLDMLHKFGIDIEPFGGKTFIIKAVPTLLADSDIKTLVNKLAREIAEIGTSAASEELTDHVLKTMACHAQVRAHHKLSTGEMQSLLNQMDQWPNTTKCPHGRPTFIEFGADEVGKWFKRT